MPDIFQLRATSPFQPHVGGLSVRNGELDWTCHCSGGGGGGGGGGGDDHGY